MLVLAVDVHQQAAQFFELGQRAGLAVNKRLAAAIFADGAAQDAVFLVIQFVGFKPLPGFRNSRDIETGVDIGTLGSVAHSSGVCAAAHGQAQGIQNDRLASTGFAGECCHALAELQFNPFSNGVVRDRQLDKHADYLRSESVVSENFEYCDSIQLL